MNPADEPADLIASGRARHADEDAEPAARRAARLLRWYPRPWRERYGEEFAELLIAEITERPHAPGRTVDIARNGIMARLAGAGLAGFPVTEPGHARDATAPGARRVPASLGTLGAAVAVFLIVGASQWSQILISWVWTMRQPPPGPGGGPADYGTDRVITMTTSAAIMVFLALGVLAAAPVAAAVAARLKAPRLHGERKRLAWPAVTLVAAAAVLVIGGRAVENSWIGTGGLHSPVPAGLAAFIWAVTLFISTYWEHLAMFAALSGAERAWMALSPVVLAVVVASAVTLVRRAGLSRRVARFEAWLGIVCCAVMAAFLAGCAAWVAYYGPLQPRLSLFNAGWINVASTGLLVLALGTGLQSVRMAMRGLRQPGS